MHKKIKKFKECLRLIKMIILFVEIGIHRWLEVRRVSPANGRLDKCCFSQMMINQFSFEFSD